MISTINYIYFYIVWSWLRRLVLHIVEAASTAWQDILMTVISGHETSLQLIQDFAAARLSTLTWF